MSVPRKFGSYTSGPGWVIVCCLVGITAAAYHGVFVNGFVFDDVAYVTGNDALRRGLSLEGLRWAFTTLLMANWHPLTWISHLADYQFFGLEPAGHHGVSLALHLLNTSLLYAVLRRGTGALWPSAFAAALFALHPLHVESVAWVSERKDVLSGAAWMTTLLAYLWYCERPGPARYVLVAAAFVPGLLAKPMVVTLPLVLLLLDFWPLGRLGGRSTRRGAGRLVAEKLPLLAGSTAVGIVALLAQRGSGTVFAIADLGLPARTANALVAAAAYLGQTVWPQGLAAYYPIPGAQPAWKVAAGGLLLAGLTAAAFRSWRRYPLFLTGWLWYVITLLPVSGLIQVGMQARADRYTYLPLVGPFVALSFGLAEVARGHRRAGRALAGCAGALVTALFLLTARQVRVWHDDLTLFRAVAAVSPDHWLPHYFLGLVQARAGRLVESEAEFRAALRLESREIEPYLRLAEVLRRLGRPGEAVQVYRNAVWVDPRSAEARWGLGATLEAAGQGADGMAHYREAARLAPANEFFRSRLAEAEARRAQTDRRSAADAARPGFPAP